jgi:RNA polymerase sigma-70 factor (ECF subfamily)
MVVVRFKPLRTAVTRQGFDAAYIDRLRDGDPQTEQHFCAYFSELIHIKARARHFPQSVVEDVRQETFLRVLRTLRTPGGLRTAECLGAFVNSVCNNVLRESRRERIRHEPPAEEPAPKPDTVTPSPEAQLISKEAKAAVRRVLDGLPPQDSRLLRAILLDERDREEICRELEVSPDYLRVLLHRAKKDFRALYKRSEDPGPGGPGPGSAPAAVSAGRTQTAIEPASAGQQGFDVHRRKALGL